ncbi:hypothetical protein IQ259_12410 [Fortiea sp. LEGE XX443]|uniref:hypothetical protein n=1 Tax=Fortiea sp. LEGE XX443 TaxID=1828611 RepID=UPI0018813CCF|nr:hypothetical protein [Fortiea sp. LEGE XX443]MBE9005829.1 hypothetical protein [Fortiea sp. LEGE XX443]
MIWWSLISEKLRGRVSHASRYNGGSLRNALARLEQTFQDSGGLNPPLISPTPDTQPTTLFFLTKNNTEGNGTSQSYSEFALNLFSAIQH